MIALGIILIIICVYVGIYFLAIGEKTGVKVTGIIIIISIFLINYDLKSPVEITERVIVTNEPENYGLNIIKPEATLVRIKVTESNSLSFGAISHDETTYELLLEEE
jgi:hypothetical protein